MPALPLWGVIVVVLSVSSIIIGLLFCLFRCRRFPRSTVDPAEYTHKKQGFPTTVSEAVSNSTQEKTICPTTTTTITSNTQPFTPTTTTTISSSSSPSSSGSILPSSAHAYSDEPLSEKHHEFDNSKAAPTSHHHQEDQKIDNFQISLPLPPPSTSFFADKMELNSDEATKMFELYMSSSEKLAHTNQNEFVSIDLTGSNHSDDHKPAFYDTISNLQHKATSTIRSTLRQSSRRQKSSAKKTNVQQVFDPVTIPTAAATAAPVTDIGKKDDNMFADDRLPASPPPLFDPTSTTLSIMPDVSSPPSPPTSKSHASSDYLSSPSIQEDKTGITLSSSPFHQLDEEADNQNSSNRTSLTTPRVSAEVSFGVDSTRTVKGRHLFDYNLDTMFAWPSGDSGDEEDDDDDTGGATKRAKEGDHRTSIGSVLHANNNDDKISITSGSVHRLVRDSTVVDSDHRSLAARSVCNSVRPSLHEMASWWSNDNESIHQDNVGSNFNDSLQDQGLPLSPHAPPADSSIVPNPPQQSISISKAMASYSSSSPTSTFSRATLKKFRAALANEEDFDDQDSDQDNDSDDNTDHNDDNDNKSNDDTNISPSPPQPTTTTTTPEPQRVTEESSIKYAVPDDELAPIAIPTFTKANTTELLSSTTTPTPSSPSSPSPSSTHSPPASPSRTVYENDSAQSSIRSRPLSINSTVSSQYQRDVVPSSPVAAVAPIRSNARNSNISIGGGNNNNNVDSVRRVLHGTWNTHRYSDHGSIASSRSNLSQGMSPPGSVNPRQLNQHLASLSLQSSNGRHPIRPGLPTGFMNEDLLVPGGATAIMGPQPTVSFSSSTVRTMIPEDEPIERHVGQKKVTAPPQQKQKQKPVPPSKQKQKKEAVTKSSTVAARPTAKDQQKQQQQSFGTMRTGRQQRGTMPWNADTSSKSKAGEKTPAQRERDRYLQSLKG